MVTVDTAVTVVVVVTVDTAVNVVVTVAVNTVVTVDGAECDMALRIMIVVAV